MAVTKIWTIKDSLQRVLDYAANPDKTENIPLPIQRSVKILGGAGILTGLVDGFPHSGVPRRFLCLGLLHHRDRKSVVEGKRVDLGGGRIIKKKKKEKALLVEE